MKVAQSCPTLWDPKDYTVHGILQARILERVAVPFFRGSSQPRDGTQISCISGRLLTSWAAREECVCINAGWGVTGGQVQTAEKLFENFGYSWEQREKARIGRGDGLKRCLFSLRGAWPWWWDGAQREKRWRSRKTAEKNWGKWQKRSLLLPLERSAQNSLQRRARAGNCRQCTGMELT